MEKSGLDDVKRWLRSTLRGYKPVGVGLKTQTWSVDMCNPLLERSVFESHAASN